MPGSRRSGGRARPAWRLLVALIATMVLYPAARTSPDQVRGIGSRLVLIGIRKVVGPPVMPAEAQLQWLIAAKDLPVSDAQLRAHFNAGLLTTDGSAALKQTCKKRQAPN